MRTIRYGVLLIFFAGTLCCKTQIAPIVQTEKETWYNFSNQGDLRSCTLYLDRIEFNSLLESDDGKGITKWPILKRLDAEHVVIGYVEQSSYTLFRLQKNGEVLGITDLLVGNSLAEVERKYVQDSLPSWLTLTTEYWYTPEKIEALKKAPGLDELKRNHLLAALQWRKPIGKLLEQYVQDNKVGNPYQTYRIVEAYRNRKLIELGYNPYKRVTYNLYKKFEGDEEVMRLLNEEIKFE